MPFTGDSFSHLFDWEKDPQRQEKIINARLEAEFDGIDAALTGIVSGTVGTAWTAYSPTVTSNTGTITTLGTVTGRCKQFGKTVFFEVSAVITTNGTGAGYVNFTLPVISAAFPYFAFGQELNVTGNLLIGHVVTSSVNMAVTNYDGTYPGGDGRRLVLSGAYEAA